jgi:WS/DGAT/MGAT family acyltransferase
MRQSVRLARAVQTAAPLALRPAPRMPWNRPVTSRRRFALTRVPFKEVRGIRGAVGGTVNDVVLTIVGGALGRYLRAHGERTEGAAVRVMIPTNVRSEDDRGTMGNRVSMMLADIPVGIEEPAERLGAVSRELERVKARDESSAFESFLRMANTVPAAMAAAAGRFGVPGGAFNIVVTNVPGPLIPLYGAGHRMLDGWSMLPLAADLGMGVAISSYDKHLYVGMVCDPTIVGDLEVVREAVDAEFAALREAAGVPASDLPEIGVRSPQPRDEPAPPAPARARAEPAASAEPAGSAR